MDQFEEPFDAKPDPGAAADCTICFGIGWESVQTARGPVVKRCTCWLRRLGDLRFRAARIPDDLRACSFENFLAYNDSLRAAVERTHAIVEKFPAERRGLLFDAPPGRGKTHLAVAAFRAMMARTTCRGYFCDTRDLLKSLRASYREGSSRTELEILNPLLDAELLLLDDMGAEKSSEWVDETMGLLINTRYSNRRLTIITTNYPDVPDPTDPYSFTARVTARVASRVHGMCELIALDATDYRYLPTNPTEECARRQWEQDKTSGRDDRADRDARGRFIDPRGIDLKWPGGRGGSSFEP